MDQTDQAVCFPPQDVARIAYSKWEARDRGGDLQLLDWLEAEGELARMGDVSRQLVDVEQRLRACLADGRLARRRLVAEHAIGEILTASTEFRDAASPILRVLCKCLSWDVGVFWLVDRHANVLRCLEFWNQSPVEITAFEQAIREHACPIGEGLPGRVWVDRTLLWIPDIAWDASVLARAVAAKAGIHGAVGFPVRNGSEYLGVMAFFSSEVREPDEALIQMMTSVSRHMSQFIERRCAENELRLQEADRSIGRQIQRGMLPKRTPVFPGYRIAGRSATANTVGGDNFDFVPMLVGGQERLGILVGDASGHGVGAALLMANTRAYLRALALTCEDVGTLLTLTNQRLVSDIVSDHFVTLVFADLAPHGSLTYSSAGHLPGYVLDRDGATRAVLSSTGIPLGINAGEAYPVSGPLSLEPGELVLLLTDGITEAVSSDETPFGVERALTIVRSHQQETPDHILDALFDALDHFCERVFRDDRTAVLIKAES